MRSPTPVRQVMLSRSIPLDDSWDVIVIGGGPSGCAAAASAAREGARTLLVEATGCLGGMGTAALVPAWTPFSDEEKLVYRGLAERVFSEAKEGISHVREGDTDWVPIDAERLKRVYDSLVTEFGASLLFNTQLSAVECEGEGRVKMVVVSNKAGLTGLKAKVYIDCTGDADLAAWSGATFQKGDAQTGKLMPATHCFLLTNVDSYAYLHGPGIYAGNPESPIYAITSSGKYPMIPDTHICNNLVGPGAVGFNAGHIWDVDNTDPWSVSCALVKGRQMAVAYRDALAEFHPKAFAGSYVANTGALMGVRESRRIVGDYVLTLDDYLSRRSFEDEICRNSYFIDIHWAQDEIARNPEAYGARKEKIMRYSPGESHGIPFRCLIPKDLKNVLVAGRSISCEQVVQGSVRVMPCCLAMGEAAGLAAALAASASAEVRAVDVKRLRERLVAQGAYIK